MSDRFKFSIEVEPPSQIKQAFIAAASKALHQTAAELDGRFTDAISSAVWPWPFPASNGKGSPRSIVDSGDLARSKVYKESALVIDWTWTIEYAAAVHEGATLWNGAILPARPWTDAVVFGGTSANVPVYDFTGNMSRRIADILN